MKYPKISEYVKAIQDAGDNLKEVADYITTSVDEDGVKNALAHFGVI